MTLTAAQLRGRQNQAKGRAEEDACANLLALAGFVVWRLHDLGQTKGRTGRRYATNSPGVPDLFAVHRGARFALFWDAKSGKARLTADQTAFIEAIMAIRSVKLVAASGDRDMLRFCLAGEGIIAPGEVLAKTYPDIGRIVTRRRKP